MPLRGAIAITTAYKSLVGNYDRLYYDLLLSKRANSVFNSILIIIDRYIKINLYILYKKIYTSVELARLLVDKVIYYYEIPIGIISD